MGLMDELKKLARPYAEDEDDFDDEYEDEYDDEGAEDEAADAPEEEEEAARPARSARTSRPERAPKQERTAARPAAGGANNIVNLRTNNNLQVILVKPERYENVSEVADHLRNKCAVVLNLESTNKDTARRLVDFLSGCAYALDGKIKKVALSTYILTPYNVDIVGDLVEEMENNGVYF